VFENHLKKSEAKNYFLPLEFSLSNKNIQYVNEV